VAFLAAAIDWWDDHYQEVARYEPEYFRLNEIMKWSLLIGFLNEGGKSELLSFLDDVNVERSNWFPTWAVNNTNLRFNLWDKIKFYERGYLGTTTEAMEFLWGKVTAGGVSLAPKTLFKNRTEIAPTIKKLNYRSNIDYASVGKATGEFKTLDGIAVKITQSGPKSVSIRNTPKPELRLRAPDSDLANVSFERVLAKTRDGLQLQADVGRTALGELNTAKTPNGFKIGWQARDIDAGQSVVLRASSSPNPAMAFAHDSSVEQIIQLAQPDSYAVKLHTSDKWMIASRGGGSEATVGSGWQSRVSDPQKGSDSFQLKWVERTVIEAEVHKSRWMAFEPSPDGRQVVAKILSRGPPEQNLTQVQIVIGEEPIAASIEHSTGTIYISTENVSKATTQRIIDIPIHIRPEQIQKLRMADNGARIPILEARRFTEPLKRGDFHRAAAEISTDPVKAMAVLDHAFANDLRAVSELVASGQAETALSQLAQMHRFYGPQIELKLWQGLAELSRGQVRRATQAFGTGGRSRIRNPDAFLDEIHARLADPRLSESARESYENLSHYAEWQLHPGLRNGPRGQAKPNIGNDSLGFEFRYVDPLHGGQEVPPPKRSRYLI
jgi:hypothetical protein